VRSQRIRSGARPRVPEGPTVPPCEITVIAVHEAIVRVRAVRNVRIYPVILDPCRRPVAQAGRIRYVAQAGGGILDAKPVGERSS